MESYTDNVRFRMAAVSPWLLPLNRWEESRESSTAAIVDTDKIGDATFVHDSRLVRQAREFELHQKHGLAVLVAISWSGRSRALDTYSL